MRKDRAKKGMFSNIKTSRISDEVYKQIVQLISNGELKPSERLPSERAISLELGVSRQSVSEALHRAEANGLIEVKSGEGSFVCSWMDKSIRRPIETILREGAERLFEFLEVRKLIEGWCAEKAALSATLQDLERMENLLDEMKKHQSGNKQWDEIDKAFHFAIADSAHHVIGMHLMEAIEIDFHDYFDFKKLLEKIDKGDLLWKQHHAIYKAIKDRDPRLAKRKIEEHLEFIEKAIRTSWEKAQLRIDQ